MINPTFCDTITLYHRDSLTNEWERTCIKGCCFIADTGEALNGVSLKDKSTYLVRISDIEIKVSMGDIVVKGSVEDPIEDAAGKRASDILSRYKPDCFTIQGVKYNTKIGLAAHIRVTGE